MIIQTNTKEKKEYKFTDVKLELPLSNTSEHVQMGVDPGTTRLGLAYIWRNICHIYEVKIVRNPDAVVRILLMQDIMSECLQMFDFAPLMVIEGSSFGEHYRQVELAEIRASAVLWAIKHGVRPKIVPPSSIRKQVLGSAKLRPEIQWDLQEYPNAANALACAYYS